VAGVCAPSTRDYDVTMVEGRDGVTRSLGDSLSDPFPFRLPGQVDSQSEPFRLKLELYLPGLSRGSTGPRHFPNREVVLD